MRVPLLGLHMKNNSVVGSCQKLIFYQSPFYIFLRDFRFVLHFHVSFVADCSKCLIGVAKICVAQTLLVTSFFYTVVREQSCFRTCKESCFKKKCAQWRKKSQRLDRPLFSLNQLADSTCGQLVEINLLWPLVNIILLCSVVGDHL